MAGKHLCRHGHTHTHTHGERERASALDYMFFPVSKPWKGNSVSFLRLTDSAPPDRIIAQQFAANSPASLHIVAMLNVCSLIWSVAKTWLVHKSAVGELFETECYRSHWVLSLVCRWTSNWVSNLITDATKVWRRPGTNIPHVSNSSETDRVQKTGNYAECSLTLAYGPNILRQECE